MNQIQATIKKLPKPPKRKIVSILWTITYAELITTAIVGFVYVGTNAGRSMQNTALRLPVGLLLVVALLNVINPFYRAFLVEPRTYAIIVFIQLSLALPAGLLTIITTFGQTPETLQSQCSSVFSAKAFEGFCRRTNTFKWLVFAFILLNWIITLGLLHRALLKVPAPREKEGALLPLSLRQGQYSQISTVDDSAGMTNRPRRSGEANNDSSANLPLMAHDEKNEKNEKHHHRDERNGGSSRHSSDEEAEQAEAHEPTGRGLGIGTGAMYDIQAPADAHWINPLPHRHSREDSEGSNPGSRTLSRSSSFGSLHSIDSRHPLVQQRLGSSESLVSLVPPLNVNGSGRFGPRPKPGSSPLGGTIPLRQPSPTPSFASGTRQNSDADSIWKLDTQSAIVDTSSYNRHSKSVVDIVADGRKPSQDAGLSLGGSKLKESFTSSPTTPRGRPSAALSNPWVQFGEEEDGHATNKEKEDDHDMDLR